MAGRSERRTVGLSVPLLLLTVTGAGAQVAPNRSTQYLFPTDVSDARALWVNPAGLGLFPEASIGLDATVGDPGAKGRLRQFTFGFNSRGLSLGYQRDVFDGGVRGSTLRIGAGFGRRKLAAGGALALYRGGTSSSGWDLGVLYAWTPAISVGGTIQDLGEPRVRGELLPVTYVPSATVQLFQGGAALSALGRVTSAGVVGYAFGLHAQLRQGTHPPVGHGPVASPGGVRVRVVARRPGSRRHGCHHTGGRQPCRCPQSVRRLDTPVRELRSSPQNALTIGPSGVLTE